MSDEPVSAPWGSFQLEPEAWARWGVGPLALWVCRTASDWRIAMSRGDDPFDHDTAHEAASSEPAPDAELHQFVARSTSGRVHVAPALADRAVVVRPEQAPTPLPGDEATIYVGSQIWARVSVEESSRLLVDTPTFRLSDTWFGASTRVGEACYAGKTRFRMNLADIPILPARAITRVDIINRGKDDLVLERVKVPVDNLALFRGANGRHWTQGLTVERGDTVGAQATVRLEPSAPDEAGPVEKVTEPRTTTPSVFSRALGALLG